ncbi:MAG: two-component system regulatory protein YycI [Anaerotignaceae bacterium]
MEAAMDWEKIKRIVIYLLVILNLGLLVANYITNKSYSLTTAEERAIYKVLSDNGIGMYTSIIKNTPPMRSLSVSVTQIDIEDMRSKFFEEGEQVNMSWEFDRTILASENKSLTIQENNIIFSNPKGTGMVKNFTKENALEVANRFLAKIYIEGTKSVQLESVETGNDYYLFHYNESYKGYKLFSNSKTICVSKDGVTSLNASFYTAQNFVGEKREIYSCDEALLAFMMEINKNETKDNIYVENIELGYDFQEATDIAEAGRIRLVPCYRIFVAGNAVPYIINAYTNQIKF